MTDFAEVGGAPDTARQAETNVREVTRVLMALRHVEAGDLAKIVGISRASMYERLSGRRAFGIGEVAVLADHFKINPAAFLAGPNALISDTAKAVGLSASAAQNGGSASHKKLAPTDRVKSREDVPSLTRQSYGPLRLLTTAAA